jgi:hypothetical protein
MTRAKDDLQLVVPQRFFVHGQHARGDRHLYASRFIPELLSLFERTSWPIVPAGTATRTPGQGPKVYIGARTAANSPRPDGACHRRHKKRAEKLKAKGKLVDFKELLRIEPDGGTTNIRNV